MLRGGGLGLLPATYRSADRSGHTPGYRGVFVGFRPTMGYQPTKTEERDER